MFQLRTRRMFTFVLSALLLAGMFAMPDGSKAGHITTITDQEASRLVGYWDLRDRDTFFQVTNTSGEDIRVHIQIFDVSTNCAEFDYFDTLTPRDTHVYDVSQLDRNNGAALAAPDLSGGHGIIGVTVVDSSDDFVNDRFITGNFRILDGAGYEYRTNFAGDDDDSDNNDIWRANFNGVDGSVFTDFVVIAFDRIDSPGSIDPQTENYNVKLLDEHENPLSCPDSVIGCEFDSDGLGNVINFGINQAVTNSKGGPSLCLGTDSAGFVELHSDDDSSENYALFIGLNNNAGSGSMDSIISVDDTTLD